MKIELTKDEISLIYSALNIIEDNFMDLLLEPSRLESVKKLIKKLEKLII